ncbi:MAG: phage/plasmid primase, P4 family [Methanosarcina sp.]
MVNNKVSCVENISYFESPSANADETVVDMNTLKQSNAPINSIATPELIEKMVQEKYAQLLAKEQEDPKKKYFDWNTFVPMRLAKEILGELSVITLSDTEEICVYENGVYKEGGESLIRQLAQEKLRDKATRYRLNEVVNYIKNERNVIIDREDLNRETRIINLKNGLYDLSTGEFRPHTPEFLSTIQIPVNYNSKATCPIFDKFLSEVVSEKDGKVVVEFAGYALIPENRMKKSCMFVGIGDNGKTVLLEFFRRFMGEENTSSESLQNLTNNNHSTANLYGKLLNIASDIGDSKIYQTNMFKALTGGDKIRGERKFQTAFDFANTARLIFAANKLPAPKDENDNAFFKRWILITFPHIFEGENADENLLEKLTTDEELSGFLNKTLEALKELLIRGEFSDNRTVEEIKRTYMVNADSFSAFIEECVERGTGGKVYKDAMYEAYVKWCPSSVTPLEKRTFDGKIKKRGIISDRDKVPDENGKRNYHWTDVSVIEK